MTIDKIKKDNILTVILEGKLDNNTAPQLVDSVKESFDDIDTLILDFKGISYVSSAGLRALLTLYKFMVAKGSMKLLHVCDDVKEIFDITGFSDFLRYE